MRFAAVNAIYEAALKDKDIFFITGDFGHTKTREFETKLKKQYFNAGVAEQNIIGLAAGLALSGKKVFVYAIAPFITLRCFEQIKIDICYQNVDVTIIGAGGGFAYGDAGGTHHTIEDVGAMRVLPNMKVICPANPMETSQLTEQIIKEGGPAYIRIGKGREEDPEDEYSVKYGKGIVLKDGSDITIISSGTILSEALKAAETLERGNISVEVINMHTIKPIDADLVTDRAKKRRAIFTLEEHNIIGGLGGAVAEVLSEVVGNKAIFKRFGVQDAWPKKVGSQQYLRDAVGISAEKVVEEITKVLNK